MLTRPKSAYHPFILIAFYLKCLPPHVLDPIPRSTRHDWQHRDTAAFYGHDWYLQNIHLLNTLQQVAASKRLLQINKAMIRIFALQRFMQVHCARIRENVYDINTVVLNNLAKISAVLGLSATLKYLRQSHHWYAKLKRSQPCRLSVFSLCRIKHPTQLLIREINTIKAYCTDPRFLHWPLASVYHQLRRDKAAAFHLGTFYKYASLLHLNRAPVSKRRKNHHAGIRAGAPLQILHADSTVFRTADNMKRYIYLVQDNFSRAILGYKVAITCKAQHTYDMLHSVFRQYLQPEHPPAIQLITDEGSENAGPVRQLVAHYSSIKHLIAQRDIEFSNSMIEAVNKQLKYRFLYHRYIPDHAALVGYVGKTLYISTCLC